MTPKSTTKLERRIEKLEAALQVIHTWAAFDIGNRGGWVQKALNPDHVIDLIDRTLDE
jgi:hypothetical protein